MKTGMEISSVLEPKQRYLGNKTLNMNTEKKIWIVIPVFNRTFHIYNLLKNLYHQTYSCFHVVIVDHGTEKIDFSFVTDSRIEVLSEDSKYWWTGAINRGIEYVITLKNPKDFILITNDDVILKENYLEAIIDAGNIYPQAIIGSISVDQITGKILSADGRLLLFRARYDSFWTGKTVKELQQDFIETDILPGRGMLIPDSVIGRIGKFNEKDLPHYGADNEFAWRANKNGISVYCSKNCIVYTSPKNKFLYQFKTNFKEFAFDTRKPGNLQAVSKKAFLCFNSNYARYFIVVTFLRFVLSYIKQFVKHYESID